MPSGKRHKDDLRAVCAQLFEDDGVDPREDKRKDAKANMEKPDRKLWQLCKQAARTIELSIASLPQADELTGVTVHSVTPAPNAGRLHVNLLATQGTSRAAIEAVIERYESRLRAEVAAAITRRRAPELTFLVIEESKDHE